MTKVLKFNLVHFLSLIMFADEKRGPDDHLSSDLLIGMSRSSLRAAEEELPSMSTLEVTRFLRNRSSQFLFWGNRATRIGELDF